MAERTFFRERNTLPGLVFVLVILLVNAREIVYKFNTESRIIANIDSITSLILIFTTVLGSSAIGFCISQFWYFFEMVFYEFLFYRTDIFPVRIIQNRFPEVENPRTLFMIYNYVSGSSDRDIKLYLERRQDLFNLFGSSIFAILFGLIIGFRLKYHFFQDIEGISKYEQSVFLFFMVLILLFIIGIFRLLNQAFHMTMIEFLRRPRAYYDLFFKNYIEKEDTIHRWANNSLSESLLNTSLYLMVGLIIFILLVCFLDVWKFVWV